MQRRELLKSAALLLAATGGPTISFPLLAANLPPAAAGDGSREHFDYAWLKGLARQIAANDYQPPTQKLPAAVTALNWDEYQAIHYRNAQALWQDHGHASHDRFRIELFHLGLYFHTPVHIYSVENGIAREIAYDANMFDYGKSGLDGDVLPHDLGFAGFRVNFAPDWQRDVAAFLGASYFRAVGGEYQYGISTRGLAVDCGLPRPEEFPMFRAFWLERPAAQADTLTVYALLDSPSISGAYRFVIKPGQTLTMDVDAALYPRQKIERLGIAPLTSMFQYGENDRRADNDWRPEIHDSDGLSMWRGNGEWIWRPLTNPAQLRFNAYADDSPHGFGLLQRDRNFDHYQDDGAFYNRRPSLWVEPKGDWGKGSVQLVELSTQDETSDNIVAFWNPDQPPLPGDELLYAYRLHWGAQMPYESPLGRVVATRTGIGGVVGRKREYFSWRFVVDFAGASLAKLLRSTQLVPVISASRGTIELSSVRPLDSVHGFRVMFDLKPDDVDSDAHSNVANAIGATNTTHTSHATGTTHTEPINLRLYLADAQGHAQSETWLYQWSPPAHNA